MAGGAHVKTNFWKESQDFERQPLRRMQFVAKLQEAHVHESATMYEQIRSLVSFVYARAVCVCMVLVLVFVVFFWCPTVPVQCLCV